MTQLKTVASSETEESFKVKLNDVETARLAGFLRYVAMMRESACESPQSLTLTKENGKLNAVATFHMFTLAMR